MVYNIGMSDATTITIKRNNDRNLAITVKKDGAAQNIAGWQILFSVKRNQNDDDSEAIIDVAGSIVSAAAGTATIPILASDTATEEVGPYYYDILVIDDQDKRQSSLTGIFDLVQEITDGS